MCESMAYTDKYVLLVEGADEAGTEALAQASADASSALAWVPDFTGQVMLRLCFSSHL